MLTLGRAPTLCGIFLLATQLSGCLADCGRCVAHVIVLRVRSTEGGPVGDVTVSGLPQSVSCVEGSSETVCESSIYFGDVTIVVEAPGYESVSLDRSFPNPNGPNCSCDHHDLDEVVELAPAS